MGPDGLEESTEVRNKIARFGSRTSFLRSFHNRSEAYFGQKSEEHVKTIKKRHMKNQKQ